MKDVFICDYQRTPIGRYGGVLAPVRPDDMAALVLATLLKRNPGLDAASVDDVILGCVGQAGEDGRNVARMAALAAGLPDTVPGSTINRLCGSGMNAISIAVNMIRVGEASVCMAGGVESMTRSPFVMPKAETAYSRQAEIFDTTIGPRFVNPVITAQYGGDTMPETAENVAEDFAISREDQDVFAARSHARAVAAQASGRFAKEIVPVEIPRRKGDPVIVDKDEHPRAETTVEKLSTLRTPFRAGGTVTAGNASGVNDGAAGLILADAEGVKRHGLTPIARVLGCAVAGVPPRIMGIGPVPAVRQLCERTGIALSDFDVIELNEAFASQALAVLRELGLPEDGETVNPNGGGISLGHPVGMSGARIVGTAALQLRETGGRFALSTMCIGIGQGIAMAIERV